ncbi:MAG: radical SAM protein, partial [bacterium]|nr:radical SAM protein [bacterium]
GRLASFRPGDILDKARRALDEGVAELWLTAQDTGAYGRDGDYPLWRLLDRLCALEGDFRIRLGMMSPRWMWEDGPALLDALAHPNMFRFLHVPVQSGADRVLSAMRRDYTADQFARVCAAFRERFPLGAIMTDVIVGYPGESEVEFGQTLDLLERVGPAAVNRSRFSPRPGTAAARLAPLLEGPALAARSRRLLEAAHRLGRAYHRRWVGRRERVLVAEMRWGRPLAHNEAWRPTVLAGQAAPGDWVTVVHTGAADYHLHAEVQKKTDP